MIKRLTNSNIFNILLATYLIFNVFIESALNSQFLGLSVLLRLIKYLSIIGIAFLWIMNTKTDNKICLFIVLLIMPVFLNSFFCNGGTFIFEIIIISGCFRSFRNGNIRSVFRTCIFSMIFAHVLIILMCKMGILADIESSKWVGDAMGGFFSGEYRRHTMGFAVSNQFPNALMLTYFMYFIYQKGYVSIKTNLLILLLNIWCFKVFGARLSFLMVLCSTIIFSGYSLYIRKKRIKLNFDTSFFWPVYLVFTILSFLACIFYNNEVIFWQELNELFNNRIKWGHGALINYGISLLGSGLIAGSDQGILYLGLPYSNVVDNGYIKLFLQRGIIISIVVISLWSILIYKSGKYQKTYLLLVLIMLGVANLIDDHIMTYKAIPYYCLIAMNQCDWSSPYDDNNLRRYELVSKKHKKIC